MGKELIEKTCTGCGGPKLLEEYYARKGTGTFAECKDCYNKRTKEYFRTKGGLVRKIYAGQRASSKSRGHSLPDYTSQELQAWLFSQPRFHELYGAWVESGYSKKLTPSCDRSDDYKSYTLDNLQIMTWQENEAKGHFDRKNGVNNKASRAVVGTSLIDDKEIHFHSIADAGRQTGISAGHISECCSGNQKTAGGYGWRYENKNYDKSDELCL